MKILKKSFRTLLFFCMSCSLLAIMSGQAKAAPKNAVTVNGFSMKFVESGPTDAQTIIFLHGVTDSSHSWSSTTPLLADKYHIYVPDLRGHGDSDRPLQGYTIAQLGDDVAAFMDALKIDKAVLVGHSMGSFIAHQVASMYPERVSKLILVSSAATAVGNSALTDAFQIVNAHDFTDPISMDFIKEWQSCPNPVAPAFFANVLQETAKVPARVWKAAFRGLLTDDHTAFLNNIQVPTLIIWAEQDSIFTKKDQATLQQAISGSTLKIYPGAGHNIQWEAGQNTRIANDIKTFLKQS